MGTTVPNKSDDENEYDSEIVPFISVNWKV